MKTHIIIIAIIILILLIIYQYLKNNIYRCANIINSFFSNRCNDMPIFDTNSFVWSKNFRDRWTEIRDEYLQYAKIFHIPNHNKINAYVASCDNVNKWRTLYLRAFNKNTNISKYFPITMDLINKCPCTLAFFSVLEPHAKLEPHIGIYKGVIRYHLGLIVPEEWDKCFIDIVGNKLYWREGEDLMFDDMFLHYVENKTDQQRVILFLDIKRNFGNIFLNTLNTIFLKFVKSNDALKNTIDNANYFALFGNR